jgi:hypothetical protein
MQDELIQEILYSEVKNATHLRSRRVHYLALLAKSGFKWLRHRVLSGNASLPCEQSLLNFLSKSKTDAPVLRERYNFIYRNDSRQGYLTRQLIAIEIGLLLAFLTGTPAFKRRLLLRCQVRMQKLLQGYHFAGFLCGHPDLLSRFIGYAFREADKHVVTMQHGIYQLSSYKVLWFEKTLATKIIVWGEAFKDLYIRQGVGAAALVIGAPNLSFVADRNPEVNALEEIRPVVIGQPFYKYHARGKSMYNDWIAQLIDFFAARNITLTYRPHPRERVKHSLEERNLKRVKLDYNNRPAFMEAYTVFYSITSTLLVEVFLNRKRAVQFDVDIDGKVYDRYANYLNMPTVTLDQLDTHLSLLSPYNFSFENGYLNLVKDSKGYNAQVLAEALAQPVTHKEEKQERA